MTVYLSTVLRAFCAITMLAMWWSDASPGLQGRWYAIGFLGVIFAFTSRRAITRQPLILLLSAGLIFYFGLRLWDIYVFDVTYIQSFASLGTLAYSDDANRAMAFAMGCSLVMYLGLALVPLPEAQPNAPQPGDFQPYRADIDKTLLFKVFLGFAAIQVVLNYATFLGNASTAEKLIAYAVNYEALLPVAAIVFAHATGAPKYQWYAILGATFLIRLLEGSRSGPVEIAEILLAWATIPGNWSWRLKITPLSAIVGVLGIVGSAAAFWLATYFRSQYLKLLGPANTPDASSLLFLLYENIAYRIGINMDTLFYVFSAQYDKGYADLHVNLYTMLMTSLRRVFSYPIGPEFTFAEFEFANLLGNPGNMVDGKMIPTGYSWGIFAYSYQMFGYWSFAVLFGAFYACARGFRALMRRSRSLARDILMVMLAHAMELSIALFDVSNLLARYRGLALSYAFIAVLWR